MTLLWGPKENTSSISMLGALELNLTWLDILFNLSYNHLGAFTKPQTTHHFKTHSFQMYKHHYPYPDE